MLDFLLQHLEGTIVIILVLCVLLLIVLTARPNRDK